MKQKVSRNRRTRSGLKAASLLPGAIVFVMLFKISLSVCAQELAPVTKNLIDYVEEANISAEEIQETLRNGGLVALGNLSFSKKNFFKQDEEAIFDAEADRSSQASKEETSSELTSDTFSYLKSQGGLVEGASAASVDSLRPSVFKLAAKFLDKVIFKSSVEFMKRVRFNDGFEMTGQPIFDRDTAGYAIIEKGKQSVQVEFEKKYKAEPIVTATLSVEQYDDPKVRAEAEDLLLISDIKYVITNVTSRGFVIKIDRPADSDIPFSWHAIAVFDPSVFRDEAKEEKTGSYKNINKGLSVEGNIFQEADSVLEIIEQSTRSTSFFSGSQDLTTPSEESSPQN